MLIIGYKLLGLRVKKIFMKGMGGKKMAQLIQSDDLCTIPSCSMKRENSGKKEKKTKCGNIHPVYKIYYKVIAIYIV